MKKAVAATWGLTVLVLVLTGDSLANSFGWQEIAGGYTDLRAVVLDSGNSKVIYFGSKSGVYRSQDAGANWRSVLLTRSGNRGVNFILQDSENNNSFYAATADGLFYTQNKGDSWQKVFKGKNYLEKDCIAIAILPYGIYLGTKGGLFVSQDRGRSWHKQNGKLGSGQILSIASGSGYIYVACIDGLYRIKDYGKSWDRVLVRHPAENESTSEEESQARDDTERFSDIRYVTLDKNNDNIVYLATARGVYKSLNRGEAWKPLPEYGLLSRSVHFLLASGSSELYAVAKSGIFRCKNNGWEELSFGLEAEEINFLAMDKYGNLYAACDKGLFKANLRDSNAVQGNNNLLSYYSEDEPKINEVQQAAIRYAEVEPDKIQRWRRQAAMRAILPRVSVGMDVDRDKTISRSIWGTYSSYSSGSISAPGRHYIGPDDTTVYRNTNWGVSLTWELGDLIWSEDQTSIDVRSRLMVELRDDILDEVTKLYFERLRVKMELDHLSIEDRRKRYEKELRLQELAASIDALTGGYFSDHLKNKAEF